MGRVTVKVPDVGEGVAEVELVSWAVAEGQTVERNQIIAEVMTDKATVEVPSPVDGVVESLTGGVGEILLVGSPLFALQVEGADDEVAAPVTEAQVTTSPAAAPTPTVSTEGLGPAASTTPAPAMASPRGAVPSAAAAISTGSTATRPSGPPASTNGAHRPEGRTPTATPAVRRRAREAGIDLRTVTGTGPAGRISHEDLDAVFAGLTQPGRPPRPTVPAPARAPDAEVTDRPIVGIRRKIAEQMVASTTTIPHITYVEEIDMTALEELRQTLNDDSAALNGGGHHRPKLTVLPFLIRAMVNEIANFPSMNAHVLDPEDGEPGAASSPATLRTFGGVHVGIATQTDGGLVVPVLRHAEAETLWTTAHRIGELAEAARSGTAERSDLTGSTITITSLGALGGVMSTPVINKPETTIVGVNKMVTRPVWIDGEFVPRKMMNLSSSFDHRVIDGWDAARFVQAIKRALEQPALLFVDRP